MVARFLQGWVGISTAVGFALGPAIASAEPKPAPAVMLPPSNAVDTPWPVAVPCAPLRFFEADGHVKTITWASADGTKSFTMGRELADGAVRLPAGISVTRLMRLWSREGPLPEVITLDCHPPSDGDDRRALEWQFFPGGRSELSVSYSFARVPRAQRLSRWLTRTPHPSGDPERASPAPFERQIAARTAGAELEHSSVKLTRDVILDLRDFLKTACAGQRCSASVRAFEPLMQTLSSSVAPSYEKLGVDSSGPQPFGVKYEWRISSEQAQAHVACHDVGDGTSFQVLTELTLSDAFGAQLRYDAFHGQVELSEPAGSIAFDELEHGARLTISGAAVALR